MGWNLCSGLGLGLVFFSNMKNVFVNYTVIGGMELVFLVRLRAGVLFKYEKSFCQLHCNCWYGTCVLG